MNKEGGIEMVMVQENILRNKEWIVKGTGEFVIPETNVVQFAKFTVLVQAQTPLEAAVKASEMFGNTPTIRSVKQGVCMEEDE